MLRSSSIHEPSDPPFRVIYKMFFMSSFSFESEEHKVSNNQWYGEEVFPNRPERAPRSTKHSDRFKKGSINQPVEKGRDGRIHTVGRFFLPH